jgi:ferric-dicitrate binding protein FerR (iron transport regulator)
MSEQQKRKLKDLLARYAKLCITNEELSELKTLVNRFDNEALDEPLRDIWMQGNYLSALPSEAQQARMIRHLEQALHKDREPMLLPGRRRLLRASFRIAAVLVLALLSSVCLYLYRSHRALTVYGNNTITLHVGNGQKAEYTLPDGTSVRINAGSTLSYAQHFGQKERWVDFSGEAFFEVKEDKQRPFTVSTRHMNIEVLGTSFNVYAFNNSHWAEMTLLTGSVRASSKKNSAWQVLVKPNEKVICDTLTGLLTVQPAQTQYETAWLTGEMVFRSEPLSRVLSKLEREYGVEIRYEGDAALLDDRFSGRISRDNTIGDVMRILSNHYSLTYERTGDRFVLSERKHR